MPRIYSSAKDRILDAAERVIIRDGPGGVSVDAVLREARISKGGFFHHFATKEALLAALIERLAASVEAETIRAAHADPERHGRALRAQVSSALEMPAAQRERIRALVLALIAAATESKEVAVAARKANEGAIRLAASEGVDVGAALVVQFALDGFFLAESLGTTALPPKRRAAFQQALLSLIHPRKRRSHGR